MARAPRPFPRPPFARRHLWTGQRLPVAGDILRASMFPVDAARPYAMRFARRQAWDYRRTTRCWRRFLGEPHEAPTLTLPPASAFRPPGQSSSRRQLTSENPTVMPLSVSKIGRRMSRGS